MTPLGAGDDKAGAFVMLSPVDGKELKIIASSDAGWDHVSVSRATRCPNWPEMSAVKDAFFDADEAAMQLHVPLDIHINVHPYCLHIWRPHHIAIPLPPTWMVGPKKGQTQEEMVAEASKAHEEFVRAIELVTTPDELHDADRIVAALERTMQIRIPRDMALVLWRSYSDSMYARWMTVRDDDDYITNCVKTYLNEMKRGRRTPTK